jgi:hypothetical protein
VVRVEAREPLASTILVGLIFALCGKVRFSARKEDIHWSCYLLCVDESLDIRRLFEENGIYFGPSDDTYPYSEGLNRAVQCLVCTGVLNGEHGFGDPKYPTYYSISSDVSAEDMLVGVADEDANCIRKAAARFGELIPGPHDGSLDFDGWFRSIKARLFSTTPES